MEKGGNGEIERAIFADLNGDTTYGETGGNGKTTKHGSKSSSQSHPEEETNRWGQKG